MFTLDSLDRHLVHHYVHDRPVAGFRRLGLPDFPHHVHAFADFSEHRVVSVEMRRGRQGNEKLAAVRIRAGVGHREDAFGVVFELRMDFVGKGITGTSAAGACGIAALNHEAVDHAMEDDTVVKVLFRQLDEIRHGVGGLLIEKFDSEIPHRRFKTGVSAGLHGSIVAFLM